MFEILKKKKKKEGEGGACHVIHYDQNVLGSVKYVGLICFRFKKSLPFNFLQSVWVLMDSEIHCLQIWTPNIISKINSY
jgi:hypothetical protein